MQVLSFAVSALLLAGGAAPREAVDCGHEVAQARQLYEHQLAERLAFAAPLVRAVRAVVDRTLTDDDRALIRGFKEGAVSAAALDRRLWPRLRRVLSRFNAASCRGLGGVAGADELVDGLTALRGGEGLHTGVVVTCARAGTGEGRRYLGLRVRPDGDGPTLVLDGVIEQREASLEVAGAPPELRRVVVRIPLGDRDAEGAALDGALAEYTGREADFTWMVPSACQQRLSTAGAAIP